LYCAILKRENFELALQKAVEVGVTRIVPVRSHRTVKFNIKRERMAAIIKEAAEQSGRGIIPVLDEPKSFPDAVGDSIHHDGRLFFDVYGSPFEVTTVHTLASVCAFIGPEGGWSDEERAAAKQAGLRSVSLGPLVMRGETAAIVAGYLLAR
jgi:16S rRNA (uracil1498-N3)-methyltransferase